MKFNQSHYFNILKYEVEKKIGFSLHTPADFNMLSFTVERDLDRSLSLSTIKRLWGYVECDYTPRVSTLSTLAAYVGYNDWDDFVKFVEEHSTRGSSFVNGDSVVTEQLAPGDEICFSWRPNRECVARFNGGNCFTVVSAANSKLEEGDTFTASFFAVGHPLYATNVIKLSGEVHTVYVAGRSEGLSAVTVKR